MRLSEEEFANLIGGNVPSNQKKKQRKYHNKKIYIYSNGIPFENKMDGLGKPIMVFDSIKEYLRWEDLKLLERAGEIKNLKRQVPITVYDEYKRDGKVVKAIVYKADFIYTQDGKNIVEDVKPFDKKTGKYQTTRDFKLKWKILKDRYSEYEFKLY